MVSRFIICFSVIINCGCICRNNDTAPIKIHAMSGKLSQNDQPITPPAENTKTNMLKYLKSERCLSAYKPANSTLNFACVNSVHIRSLMLGRLCFKFGYNGCKHEQPQNAQTNNLAVTYLRLLMFVVSVSCFISDY